MGNYISSRLDYDVWEYTEEPHATRRKQILEAHPEVKNLMTSKPDTKLAWIGFAVVMVHFLLAYISTTIPHMPLRFLFAFVFGAPVAGWLYMLNHEAAHGLIFGPNNIQANRWYGIFINLALSLPAYATFKWEHKEHHKHQGDREWDDVLPHRSEAEFFSQNSALKYTWFMCNPLVRVVRNRFKPNLVKKHAAERRLNLACVVLFDLLLLYFNMHYMLGYIMVAAFIGSSQILCGFINLTAHPGFLSDEPTVSYYGWYNMFMVNLGYHLEHHDFPNVPSRNLPKLREIAPEYYSDFHHYDSVHTSMIAIVFNEQIGIRGKLKPAPGK